MMWREPRPSPASLSRCVDLLRDCQKDAPADIETFALMEVTPEGYEGSDWVPNTLRVSADAGAAILRDFILFAAPHASAWSSENGLDPLRTLHHLLLAARHDLLASRDETPVRYWLHLFSLLPSFNSTASDDPAFCDAVDWLRTIAPHHEQELGVVPSMDLNGVRTDLVRGIDECLQAR